MLLNCDMGESFGIYSLGADAAIMPHIDLANVACGFHGSDANHMSATVRLAIRHGVAIGAHPSLPDLQGFGRREMAIGREELRNVILYQVGALTAFLRASGARLSHIKPHGALYGMTARDPEAAGAMADAADVFDVPIMGLAGTLHESVYTARGHAFWPEYFADLDYDPQGKLVITRTHPQIDAALVEARVHAALEGRLLTRDGGELPLRASTICIHSDTPNAADLSRRIARILQNKTR
ncbi:5-oxoprolinase subunit PxpA [Microbulbifer sp. S227A]|uniref:5-oxoprolinase subunit PxpA n=1 Tax=Microbulbifer sp. S227A TaxID=3415131 RepID=UPI003C7B2A2B